VYGEWPDQPDHVVPFFTSMMTAAQVRRAARIAQGKRIAGPLRVLFSGRLVVAKRAAALIEAAALLDRQNVAVEVVVVGDGPLRSELERQVEALRLSSSVRFAGAVPYEEALSWYEWAHCLVLPSRHSEGWPKVVSEAMCHGVVCVAVRHGQIPRMLDGRGIVLPHGTAGEIADALHRVAADPDAFRPMMADAAAWARGYSLDTLREALSDLLGRSWGRSLPVQRWA
jgi:glycosyltransferase involved in cell wall biosynthesis